MKRIPPGVWILLAIVLVAIGFSVSHNVKTRSVEVLKEGTFTITNGQPLVIGNEIQRDYQPTPDFQEMYDYNVDIKVISGDAVQIKTTFPILPDDVKPNASNVSDQLSTNSPIKEIKLNSRISKSETGETVIRFAITTIGQTSDVAVKVTKELRLYDKKNGILH